MKGKNQKNMTSKEFNAIKRLQKAGLTLAEASEVIKRSTVTIRRVYATDTLEEYIKVVRSYYRENSTDDAPLELPDEGAPEASDATIGTDEDFIARKAKELGHFQEIIDDVMKNYDGDLVAMVHLKTNDKAELEEMRSCVTGAASVEASIKMVEALEQLTEQLKSEVGKRIKADLLEAVFKKKGK